MPSVTIDQPIFLAMLNRACAFIQSKSTIPVLECVLLEVGDTFTVKGTNLDIEATVRTSESKCEGAGSVCVFARRLREIVRLCDASAPLIVQWAEGDRALSLTSGPAQFRLTGLPVSDFPLMVDSELTHQFSLPVEDARLLFQKTLFAISTEETRYYLNGAYLHQDGDKLRAVATDGHRMAIQDVALPDGADGMPGVIVPGYTIRGLRHLLNARGLNGIHFAVGPARIKVEIGGLSISSRLIEGSFPNYRRALPGNSNMRLTAGTRHIAAAARRVRAVHSDCMECLAFQMEDGALLISAKSADWGEASERLPVETHGEPIKIGLNARYLLDGLAAHGDVDVTIEMIDPGAPTKITGAPGLTVIQMPMRI